MSRLHEGGCLPNGGKMSVSDQIASACMVLVLLCAAATRLTLPRPEDASAYHLHVSQVASGIGLNSGNWVGEDVPVPPETKGMLNPNVMVSRRWRNVVTGREAMVLIVQCPDARDLVGHYPPVCYPAHGLTQTSGRLIDLKIDDGLTVRATRYSFEPSTYRPKSAVHVDNLMILPDGRVEPDQNGMARQMTGDNRYFGAAEVQIIHSDNTYDVDQTLVSQELLQIYRKLIDAVRDGKKK